jgi:hypothetical protein
MFNYAYDVPCRHANRKSVGIEDVRLGARRSEELVGALDDFARARGLEPRSAGRAAGGAGNKRKAPVQTVPDDDDDDGDDGGAGGQAAAEAQAGADGDGDD